MKDLSILKIVVVGLVLLLIILAVGMILMVLQGMSIPGTFETLTGMTVTGLLGLLAPSRTAAQGD
jgi:hypothetical protein